MAPSICFACPALRATVSALEAPTAAADVPPLATIAPACSATDVPVRRALFSRSPSRSPAVGGRWGLGSFDAFSAAFAPSGSGSVPGRPPSGDPSWTVRAAAVQALPPSFPLGGPGAGPPA
jgi:hypothetical protein